MGSSFSTKFERKFGKYAIPNISLYLIICYAVGYLISLIYPAFLGYLTLDPFKIFLQGQVWRLVTWILIPPSTSNLFFTLIMLCSIIPSERSWRGPGEPTGIICTSFWV